LKNLNENKIGKFLEDHLCTYCAYDYYENKRARKTETISRI